MKKFLLISYLCTLLLCSCAGNKGKDKPAKKTLTVEEKANQYGMIKILKDQIIRLIELEQYDAALFQIEHTELIIDKIEIKSEKVKEYRDGELLFRKAEALEKSGQRNKSAKVYRKLINSSETKWSTEAEKKIKVMQRQ
ncbi:MAG: hypothetical protein ACYTFY_01995 [Planctomycetota bacterium]|jgi:carbamoylphosphate synthase large subunit